MCLYTLLIVVAGLLVAADDPKGAKVKKELEKLQGTWKVARAEVNGKKMPQQAYRRVVVIFDSDQITFKDGDTVYDEIKIAVDPSKKPKTVDLEHIGKKLNGKTELGIYELKGDDLKICFAPYGSNKRASEFVTTDGLGWTSYALRRDKP